MEFLLELWETFGDGVFSFVGGVIGWCVGMLAQGILMLASALPDNFLELPAVLDSWDTGLCWLNWFVPIGEMEAMLLAWVAATIVFYSSRYVARVVFNLYMGSKELIP